MNNTIHSIILIAIAGVISLVCRLAPFAIFSGKREMPVTLKRVTEALPPAIIAVLVIYCLKDAIVNISMNTVSSFLAIIAVVLVHIYKRNTLLSIAIGTIVYMLLIRII